MMKELISYNDSLMLRELGFDEACFAWYSNGQLILEHHIIFTGDQYYMRKEDCNAPTFSQAFRFFREKYQWQSYIEPTSDQHSRELGYNYCLWNYKTGEEYNTMPQNCPSGDWEFEKYEDAELACLIKLIEINS
jgi:hypothetical protein